MEEQDWKNKQLLHTTLAFSNYDKLLTLIKQYGVE